MLSQEALQKILGIKEKVYLSEADMADKLNITFFPFVHHEVSSHIRAFAERLQVTFRELKVNIVPYEDATESLPISKVFKRFARIIGSNILFVFKKIFGMGEHEYYIPLSSIPRFLKRTRVKKGISIVALGEQVSGDLPMEYIYNFKDNSVINVIDFPDGITADTDFQKHFDTAMGFFSHHMANIILAVDAKRWLVYNFNASHPIYDLTKDFSKNVLHALIPKIVAPISPHKFSEFTQLPGAFDVSGEDYRNLVDDLVGGAKLFAQTDLYPDGKKIDDLAFRDNFYRWVGRLHLDNRNGMSFGFLAKQIPTKLSTLIPFAELSPSLAKRVLFEKDYFVDGDTIYIILDLAGQGRFALEVPEVWVLSQRSGSDKTNVTPEKDLIKLGLSHGRLCMQLPKGLKIDNNYRPSFDTKVILAHALGNSIIASILEYFDSDSSFVKNYKAGLGLAHWHGYFNPKGVPQGWFVHGFMNPHVACSSPQSAIYALDGKLRVFSRAQEKGEAFLGDIHVEPQHGTNICFTSLVDLAQFLINNPGVSILGNKYLSLYNI